MICLKIDREIEKRTKADELFVDLQHAPSENERQKLVTVALLSGVPQHDIREMLDYIESFGRELGFAQPSSTLTEVQTRSSGSWASFISALIYRYR